MRDKQVTRVGQWPRHTGIDEQSEAAFMKAYVMTSGTIFGLIVLAHIWRVTAEGPELARDPVYITTTLAAAGLSPVGMAGAQEAVSRAVPTRVAYL